VTPRRPLRALARYFLRGLIVVVPIAATAIAVRWVFVEIDTWVNVEPLLNRRIPGAGIVLTAIAITLVGFLASNFATKWMFSALEDLLEHTPLVKLVYSSLKDIMGAFVGEKKKFDRPVMVALVEGSDVATIGFVTRGALKELGPRAGEIKSMRTADGHLRRGVAAAILEYLVAEARGRGYARLSLETGSGPAFEPALELYRKYGFTEGGAFADYEKSPFNQFLHLDLVSTSSNVANEI